MSAETQTSATARAHTYDLPHPQLFTRESVGWVPWLDPLPEDEITDRHREGATDPGRLRSPYFRLLVRDPEVLRARTLTDNDIFYNDVDGLPRAERELAATTASRVNGCVFCASVHARAAAKLSGRPDDVDRLLADGVDADLDPRWSVIAEAVSALTVTPIAFGPAHAAALRDAGLTSKEIVDVVQSGAFFNWANRLMLSVGRAVEPGVPTS